jgi:hypothetical protein
MATRSNAQAPQGVKDAVIVGIRDLAIMGAGALINQLPAIADWVIEKTTANAQALLSQGQAKRLIYLPDGRVLTIKIDLTEVPGLQEHLTAVAAGEPTELVNNVVLYDLNETEFVTAQVTGQSSAPEGGGVNLFGAIQVAW